MGRIVSKCFESLTITSLITAGKQQIVVSDTITLLTEDWNAEHTDYKWNI